MFQTCFCGTPTPKMDRAVFILNLYYKLVAVVEELAFQWKGLFFSIKSIPCSLYKPVVLWVFPLLCKRGQLCGVGMPCG